ncbi:hypothetical protein DL769_004421 [Monosporascus sp. CRB-8-3]|nr:hypothetical protein DL769_004421 [Monosporascus sp. CRB-8-3]
MRLLNSCTREMREFVSDPRVPAYAILSHTWGSTEDECSFQEWQHLPAPAIERKKGFQKIECCCRQAAKDGLEWVWIDTCCIDKTSSAELTEAINSMFRWYRNAKICYAYLSDVSRLGRPSTFYQRLERSRWFTRGWTLQELIAPAEVIFYSMDWDRIGTKSELSTSISSITKINAFFLDGKNLASASVAQRMSWAAHRETSRTEDIAYCLLGIFDVNMPLIYGEGMKAFQRLQEEIIKSYPYEYTLFAWGTPVSKYSREITDPESLVGDKPLEWEPSKDSDDLLGLLAESPRDFESSGQYVCIWDCAVYLFFQRNQIMKSIVSHAGKTLGLYLSLQPPVRHHEVALPSDTWKVDISPEIKVRIKTERISLNDDPSRPVDVVDIVAADKEMAPHWFEEPTTPGHQVALLEQGQEIRSPEESGEGMGSSSPNAGGHRPQTRALSRALRKRPGTLPAESSHAASGSENQNRQSGRKRRRTRSTI